MNNRIDGRLFRQMVCEAAQAIEAHKQELNDLNVFPVPDGDTGTNMSLSIGAAAKALEGSDEANLGTVAETAAMALLRGARGNSGVILSLLFRGIGRTLKGQDSADGALFAEALKNGTDTAYKAVMKPAEGTILTVSHKAAQAAVEAAHGVNHVRVVIAAAYDAAMKALPETTAQNPVLAKAGVIDAGAAGWVRVLESMLRVLRGQQAAPASAPAAPGTGDAQGASVGFAGDSPKEGKIQTDIPAAHFETEDIRFAYCTEFIVGRSGDADINFLRAFLDDIGDSMVMVDDEEIIKVHVHTNNPGRVLEEALAYGALESIKIENMKLQHSHQVLQAAMMAANSPAQPEPPPTQSAAQPEPPAVQLSVGFVAVVAGEGLRSVFRDLGVHALVEGGQTMNPSTLEICEAVESVPAPVVFVLPNNKNIIMAAQQAAPLTDKTLIVLPTVSIPQGITAMLSYDPELTPEENREAMEAALAQVHTAQLTYAARDSVYEEHKIRAGDYLALLDGRLVDAGRREHDTMRRLTRELGRMKNLSYITVFYGEGMTEEQASEVRELLEKECRGAEVAVLYGGQPIYYYIISAE